MHAGERILEVDKKATNEKTTIAQIPKNEEKKKPANDSGSINQCFSATAITNIRRKNKRK